MNTTTVLKDGFPSRARTLLTASCAALGGGLAWWHWRGLGFAAFAVGTGALLALALFRPRAYAPFLGVLDGLVRGVLQVFTWLLLGLVFALVFVPGRLVLVLRRHDPLDRRPDAGRASYWRDMKPAKTDPARRFRAQF